MENFMHAFNFWAYFIVLISAITTGIEKQITKELSSPESYKFQAGISLVLLILLVAYK